MGNIHQRFLFKTLEREMPMEQEKHEDETFEQRFDRLYAEIKATQSEIKDLLNLLIEKLVKSGRIQP
jgi:hypothetical protein